MICESREHLDRLIHWNILTLHSIITPLKYHVYENVMENGAFALSEQMLHFPSIIFSKVFKTLFKIFLDFFQCCLKIEKDVII